MGVFTVLIAASVIAANVAEVRPGFNSGSSSLPSAHPVANYLTERGEFDCGLCSTFQWYDPNMVEQPYMDHDFFGLAREEAVGPVDGRFAFGETIRSLEYSLLGGPSDELLDSEPYAPTMRDYYYMGQSRRRCDLEGCHEDIYYGDCFTHGSCPGDDDLDVDQIRSDLTGNFTAAVELKLRILLEQHKAIVVSNNLQFLKCNGTVGASVTLTPKLRTLVAHLDAKLLSE